MLVCQFGAKLGQTRALGSKHNDAANLWCKPQRRRKTWRTCTLKLLGLGSLINRVFFSVSSRHQENQDDSRRFKIDRLTSLKKINSVDILMQRIETIHCREPAESGSRFGLRSCPSSKTRHPSCPRQRSSTISST